VALRIVEQAGTTDVGRQRQTNEDSLVVSPPVFAVADGMGGAKAGEVASQLAAEEVVGGRGAAEPPEVQLAGMAREANRRIYELATADESRRGMGTTLTAAMVSGDEVSIGHVGDSRAYRLRDGQIEQLTRDHSLVAELERTGQISAEAAEHHPQRSIITRALGPEPDVQVDTYTVPGRPGDVFLLCSDGLTSMISDDEAGAIVQGAGSLQEAAQELVRAANQSGGKDNITVVLFRLGEDEAGPRPSAPAEDETIAGGLHADDVRAADAPAEAPPAPAAPPPEQAPRRAPARRRGRVRRLLTGVVGVAVLAAVAAGLYAGSRQVYFVGTNDAGLVTLYRGLPYELPLGLELYTEEYASTVPARAIPTRRRDRVLDHEWRSRSDAVDLVRQLERGRLDPGRARR
jgi:PPM family protein phosphatase